MDLVNSLEGRLLFAVPSKGRLNQAALNLLEGADIRFKREHRLDIAFVKNLPIALIFLRAADIPTFVGEGSVDLGITGWDQVQEYHAVVRSHSTVDDPVKRVGSVKLLDLEFGYCKLQVQVPKKGPYVTSKDLIGKTIGTSFSHLVTEHFARLEAEMEGSSTEEKLQGQKMKTKIIELGGSVEAACALGVADGIADLVESGETMKAAGLQAIETVVESQAVLIKSCNPSNIELVEKIAQRIEGKTAARRNVLCQYNILRSKLADAIKITPGMRAPTITALDTEGWVAVSSMVLKRDIAVVMDELVGAGAQDIIVLSIANSRPGH